MGFSSYDRSKILQKLANDHYDVVVIGGGVTGAGIVLDAASRGLNAALIEKSDFASGTSSKSTKLIHGGLRYLKQMDIGLVRESGRERAVVNQLAPHLCIPEKMLLPIIEKGTFGKFSTSLGLKVYDWIAGVQKEDSRQMLDKEETLTEEPLLNQEILRGSGLYAEYRTDDARLTIELLKKAASLGATICNYVMAVNFIEKDGRLSSLNCSDQLDETVLTISGKTFIAAAGPWVDQLRLNNDRSVKKQLYLTKGVHIVVPFSRLPVRHSIYFDVPDGRMIFAIPRNKTVYIGTTDTEYHGDLNRIIATEEDRDYLIKACNHMFPAVNLTKFDVISSWSGLRPLIKEEGKDPSEISRKDEIFEERNGLLSIAGGKLTGYRKMSERIVDIVMKQIHEENGVKFKKAVTKNLLLTPEPFSGNQEVHDYTEKLKSECEQIGLDSNDAEYLVSTYGKQSDQILDKAIKVESRDPNLSLVLAELDFCLEHELIFRLDDFFIRRTAKLYFDIHQIEDVKDEVVERMAVALNWDDDRKKKEIDNFEMQIQDATTFYKSELSELISPAV